MKNKIQHLQRDLFIFAFDQVVTAQPNRKNNSQNERPKSDKVLCNFANAFHRHQRDEPGTRMGTYCTL